MHTGNFNLSTELIKKIVNCVADAVGDDILTDIRKNRLKTKNSIPSRIWDLINTNLIERLEAEDCTIAIANRGPWDMIIIYEKTTHNIITFMREKRFAQIRKNQRKRNHMHYVDVFSKYFNHELLASNQQLSILPHHFSDESQLAELAHKLLHDLENSTDIVKHHVLVLFDTVGYQLTHIRAVMVTPSLDTALNCEQDWSKYIPNTESIIVEQVINPDTPENQPNRGLSLTSKALERKKNKPQQKTSATETEAEA